MDLETYREALNRQRKDFRWEIYHTPENLAAALASEAGELLHLFRWCPQSPLPNKGAVADELADVLIFAIQLADHMGIDLDRSVGHKIIENRERFGG